MRVYLAASCCQAQELRERCIRVYREGIKTQIRQEKEEEREEGKEVRDGKSSHLNADHTRLVGLHG